MGTELKAILGEQLLSGDGAQVPLGEALAGKAACVLYFSAHWCGPCRGFTPALADAYKGYKAAGGAEAEIVFVSWDKDGDAFKEYFAEMPWLSLPFDETKELRERLGPKFGVNGIPALVALGPDGTELYGRDDGVDLRQLVGQHKEKAFPMTPACVAELKKEQEAQAAALLKELASGSLLPLVRAPGKETPDVSAVDLLQKYEHLAVLFSDGDVSDGTYKFISNLQSEVNAGGERLGVLYLGWSLYNDQSDHGPLAKDHYSLLDLSEELKTKLGKLPDSGVRAPHVMVISGGSAPALVANDPGARLVQEFGAGGYPWSKARVEELRAVEKARIDALKEKQVNLQFLKGAEGRDGLLAKGGAETKVDALAGMGSEAVIGVYFSAHWCPPCRGFTPTLAKCYEDVRAAGKSFEVVFVSSDKDEDSFKEYFADMPWLALPFPERDLAKDLKAVFEVEGIPTLVLLKPDGTLLMKEGREAVNLGPEHFPWGPADMERGRAELAAKQAREKEAAIKAEAAVVAEQEASGGPVLKRLRGEPGEALVHDPKERTVEFKGFSTLGAPGSLASSGVVYYEVEIIRQDGIPQFGFAACDFQVDVDGYSGEGVGDDGASWGVDGVRKLAWHAGARPWDCAWSDGDTIGLAASADAGKVAVSKNGSWTDGACGVVFESDKIKAGVYPCLTGGGYKVRYNLDGASHGPFKYSAPPAEVWTAAAA